MSLHHIAINWPKAIPTAFDNIPIIPTKHAQDRAEEKGIHLPSTISGKAFECEYLNGRMTKVALRCRYSGTHDLCVVLSGTGVLITCWLNHIQDTHRTLDRSKYAG